MPTGLTLKGWCFGVVRASWELAGSWELPLLHLTHQSHLLKKSKAVPDQGVQLEEKGGWEEKREIPWEMKVSKRSFKRDKLQPCP